MLPVFLTNRRYYEHHNVYTDFLDHRFVHQSYKVFYRIDDHRESLSYTEEIRTVHQVDNGDSKVQNVANSTVEFCLYRNWPVHSYRSIDRRIRWIDNILRFDFSTNL